MKANCTNTECPIQEHNMFYCCDGSEIDPPCSDMNQEELEELSEEIYKADELRRGY